MQQFSIRDMELLSGIKSHTLRIWEQRYGILNPERADGKHRIYSNADLQQLLRISALNKQGYKISKLANMSTELMNELLAHQPPPSQLEENYVLQLLLDALNLDPESFENLLRKCLLHIGFDRALESVLFPLLERIGLLWLTENVIPAQEHFVSNYVSHAIIRAIDGLPHPSKNAAQILVFTAPGEAHEIPILAWHYHIRKSGCRCLYAGPEASYPLLQQLVNASPCKAAVIHGLTWLHKEDIDQYMKALQQNLPSLQWSISGPIAQLVNQAKFPDWHLITHAEAQQQWLKTIQP